MSRPTRIQMTRTTPWRPAHPDAVRVDRATRWGNPFTIAECGSAQRAVQRYREALLHGKLPSIGKWPAVTVAEVRAQLRGRELACWCRLDGPCHADVLLHIAAQPDNGG